VQATGEAFSPQKRIFSTSKNEIYNFLRDIFALLDPEPDPGCESGGTPLNPDPGRIRIHNRIHNTGFHQVYFSSNYFPRTVILIFLTFL
jgi:hypothetical protein